ncbi:hypothetical protein GYMLUDRAFT_250821 [Collybiopsis luxurians FD-317 M1]|uniref:Uncharacterized protein n=1 Tax=Collybiopsis luxurians FD-317 M1 TaxID=944289 RepID=A0A0D0BTB5_9AGAR|nr:hypothetical protein GYMLUDRAFT_250821 [Collybiopsis luxurians FD-317 M1]
MATYTLHVEIDPSQLVELKKGGYNLCIARKVGDMYNVIWKGDTQYLSSNTFKWTQEYKVFASRPFQERALVQPVSNEEKIEYKQQCTLNEYGVMESALNDPQGRPGSFKVVNNYGATHIAVSAKMDGEYSAIYNSTDPITPIATLTPIDEVRVWFGLKQETGTMFSNISGEYIDVKYGGLDFQGIMYTPDGQWWLLD